MKKLKKEHEIMDRNREELNDIHLLKKKVGLLEVQLSEKNSSQKKEDGLLRKDYAVLEPIKESRVEDSLLEEAAQVDRL